MSHIAGIIIGLLIFFVGRYYIRMFRAYVDSVIVRIYELNEQERNKIAEQTRRAQNDQ